MNPECKQIRQDILKVSKVSGHGHLPSCFSVVEILCAVYEWMKHDPGNPRSADRDIFVLSKGHAALAHYCLLARLGYFSKQKIEAFGSFRSDFGCHEDRLKVPGIEISTGSLGHGIGVAVGIALALKLKGSERKVFVLIGDGESNEGTVWEAVGVAANLKLDHLTILFDFNKSQIRGLQILKPAECFRSFGCQAIEVDGHDLDQLKQAISADSDRPKVIVAQTQKGFGCRTLIENMHAWHRRAPSEKEFDMLMEELNA